MLGKRQRHHLGELVDAALRHRIGHLVGDREDRVDRRHVDDRARFLAGLHALDHVPRHRLPAQERTLEVGADDAVEVALLQLEKILRRQHRRVVDEHIDWPERADRGVDQIAHRGHVADVATHVAHRTEPAEVSDRGRAGVVVHVGNHDARALGEEAPGNGVADAAGAAGDDRNLF